MNDKYDDAGILIRPTVKLESEMDIESLCKWLRENSSGIYRKSADAAYLIEQLTEENARLQSVIDEANAQEPIYQAQTVGGLWSDVTAENYAKHAIWRIVYVRQIPAQQSNRILFNGSDGHAGYVIEERQSPAVAVPDCNKPVARAHVTTTDSWPDVRIEILDGSFFQSATVELFAAHIPCSSICDTCKGAGTYDERFGGYFFSNPKAKCPDCNGVGELNSSPRITEQEDKTISSNASQWSQRVTEQDAREIAKDVFEYVDARNNPRIEDWEEVCLLGLLAKLNKPDSVGG